MQISRDTTNVLAARGTVEATPGLPEWITYKLYRTLDHASGEMTPNIPEPDHQIDTT